MEEANVEEDEEEEVEEKPVKIKRARRVANKKETTQTNAEEVD